MMSAATKKRATVQKAIDSERFAKIPGVANVVVSDHRLQCTVTGAMEPLLDALTPAVVVSLDSTEMSLEEVFLSLTTEDMSTIAAEEATHE